ATPEQGPGRHPGRDQRSAPDRERCDADTATDEDRPDRLRREIARRRERAAEWTDDPQSIAGPERHQAVGPRTDGLGEEIETDPVAPLLGAGHRERPR